MLNVCVNVCVNAASVRQYSILLRANLFEFQIAVARCQ